MIHYLIRFTKWWLSIHNSVILFAFISWNSSIKNNFSSSIIWFSWNSLYRKVKINAWSLLCIFNFFGYSSLTRDQATPVKVLSLNFWTAKEFPLFCILINCLNSFVEQGVTKQRRRVGRVVEWKEHRPWIWTASWLHHFLAVWPWASLPSLNFLNCRLEILLPVSPHLQ